MQPKSVCVTLDGILFSLLWNKCHILFYICLKRPYFEGLKADRFTVYMAPYHDNTFTGIMRYKNLRGWEIVVENYLEFLKRFFLHTIMLQYVQIKDKFVEIV